MPVQAQEDPISVLSRIEPGLHIGWMGIHDYYVVDRWELSPHAGRIECEPVSEFETREVLERFVFEDGLGSVALRRFVLRLRSGDLQLWRMDDRQVLDMVLDELHGITGHLVMVKVRISIPHHPIPFWEWADDAPSSKAVEPEPVSEAEPQWIEFEVLDTDGDPVATLPYTLTLPDKADRPGRLDGDGYAFANTIQSGSCDIRFHQEERPEQQTPGDWVKIALAGEDGEPCADWEYELQLPDGSSRRGRLDERGQAYVWTEESGDCRLRFIDPEDPEAQGGEAGDTGDTGNAGDTGDTGNAGDTGDTGNRGSGE